MEMFVDPIDVPECVGENSLMKSNDKLYLFPMWFKINKMILRYAHKQKRKQNKRIYVQNQQDIKCLVLFLRSNSLRITREEERT